MSCGEAVTTPPNSTTGVVVEVGAVAVADPCQGAIAVPAGTVVPLITDLNSRLIATVFGYPAHDAVDCGDPVKIGMRAVTDPTVGFAAAVAVNDRVDAAGDLNGRLLALVEGTQVQDAPVVATNNPVLVGAYSADQVPAFVSAVGDLTRVYSDRGGRVETAFEQQIAGENLPQNFLAVMRAKRMTEQETWIPTVWDNVTQGVVKATAGRLAHLQIINTSATGLYVLVHDNTNAGTLVAGGIMYRGWVNAIAGAVPGVLVIAMEDLDGVYFNRGISWTTSTSVNSVAGAVAVYGNSFHM